MASFKSIGMRGLAGAAALLVAMIVVMTANAALADTVMKLDGSIYTGRILSETTATVTMEVEKHGAKLLVKIPRSQIHSIIRGAAPAATAPATDPADVASQPTYYPLPVTGWIGVDLLVEDFAEALKDVQAKRPDYLVVYVNSPGGLVTEVDRIVAMLAEAKAKAKGMRLVAYIRKAHGAAAALALSFEQIHMDPTGTIRAAAGEHPPEQVAALGQKQIDAHIRQAAKAAGHPALIAQGLTDPELDLTVEIVDGKPVVKLGGTGRPLKAKEQPLALTGQLAADCGLAAGVAKDLASVHKQLALKSWRRVDGIGWSLLLRKEAVRRHQREQAKRQRRRQEYERQRQEYLRQVEPELANIEAEIEEIRDEGAAVSAEKAELLEKYNEAVARVHQAYRDRIRNLDRKAPSYHVEVLRAKHIRDRDMGRAKQANRPEAERIQAQIDRLLKEMKRLQAEKKKLLDAGPKLEDMPK